MEKLLMTPGPTNVPERVLNKMNEKMIHHRTSEYSNLFREFNERLKFVFQTSNNVLTFPSAGTGALEASIANCFSTGDRILAVSIGDFGDRFIQIAKIYGLTVDEIKVPWGKAVSLEEIKNNLKDYHKGLIITHNETSTGAVNPIKEIGEYLKDKNILYIVDAVSSLGGIDIRMDEWNIDVIVTASQKALMSPPGLSFVGVSKKAFEYCKVSNIPKFYFDFLNANKFLEKADPQNPYTPAVSLISAANEALAMIEEEGLNNVFLRHKILADKFREEIKGMGLNIFTDENALSNTITAISFENANDIKNRLEKEYNIIVAGGQGAAKGKMIRVGHMGCINEEMIYRTMNAIREII
ncbi:alanine--glyoxylate aminotransferase family protein [Clostridium sp. MSJ-11]|uniref:Alanine--glyoxylate aminotransferase family protein n=1 Tax=Clostridium mobile TaxID=2841512 RepID=A0ABS6EEE6_9CLOT|nr:alanine--glyoxylate aminotransferase family protein [Clostridium mobile]MBU5483585.1 alanine--glyoxylate aminotransferase family protein [Clostridium mobile]